MKRRSLVTVVTAVCCLSGTSLATPGTIDFGVSWPALSNAIYSDSSSPYSRLIFAEPGLHSNETAIADLLNRALGVSSFTSGLVFKTDLGSGAEIDPPDGYFLVPSGWNYLVVQYDGPQGGSILLNLGGNGAKVPFDSSLIWGAGDKYAVSHYSLASRRETRQVPDGGATLSLLGLALGGMALARRLVRS